MRESLGAINPKNADSGRLTYRLSTISSCPHTSDFLLNFSVHFLWTNAVSSSQNPNSADLSFKDMDLEGLSTICAGLGVIEEDDKGNRIGYTKSEFCLDNLKDLQRFLRRDDPQTRSVFKQVCRWNTASKALVPIIEHCQDDRNLVIGAVKVLVFLTMPIDPTSNDIPQQIEYLWGLKASISRNDAIVVIVSLLEAPLENLESEAFTEEDWKLVQLVVTLFRNILAIQDISMQIKASGSATQFLSLRDRFLELLFQENVMDLILVLAQHIGGSNGYLRQDNLLLLETFYYIFLGQDPELIAKASRNNFKVDETVKESLSSLRSIMEEEKDKRRLTRLRNLDRHSQFSGTFTRLAMDGSKSLFKGNPASSSHDSLLKPHKVHRGPIKRIVWDHGKLSSSKGNILEMLHEFLNQLLSGSYNGLMESIREDIEKEHHAIENSDVLVFFNVAQFITAFQHHKFLISKPQMETNATEGFTNKYADSTLFQGNICGPIATTMNEAMFLLVLSKWRNAFDGLKETNEYKFLSASGSLLKTMICMLDLVLKLLPEDSREAQTARILLYKIFYDQTDQGLMQFLMNLLRVFDTHKQPKSDLADLIEMIHVLIRLIEKFEASGTLRVSRKSRIKRKRNVPGNMKATMNETLNKAPVNVENDIGNSTEDPPLDTRSEELLRRSSSDGNNEGIVGPVQVEDHGMFSINADNIVDASALPKNRNISSKHDDLAYATGDSSEDDEPAATVEVDFKVSSLVSNIANNNVVHKLCWLLKYYKSNSTRTNHHIICMLRRICEDLQLSPILYQLSLLTIFHDILVEQKSSPSKEYANIVSFLNSVVRKMLRKLKSQPLLFVEILFWKTRKECHYITSESLLHELGNFKKGSGAGGEGERVQDKGRTSRSIADSLGDDEADFAIPDDPRSQEEQDQHGVKHPKIAPRFGESVDEVGNSKASNSRIELDELENYNVEVPSLGPKSQQIPKRRKRLTLDKELEENIRNLYEKYRNDQHCSRLIADTLDPNGGISLFQVSSKLKQLGLKVASKKKMPHAVGLSHGRDNEIQAEGLDMEKLSSLKSSSRKRVHAFSKEHEQMLKELFEQFKDHEKCSYMIAKALDADNTFTAAQVSRKIKQLGLQMPRKRRFSEAKLHLRDEDSGDLFTVEKDEDSDEETLSVLKKRSIDNIKNMRLKEEASTDFPKQKTKANLLQDDSADEILSSILGKSGGKFIARSWGRLNENDSAIGVHRDTIERDELADSYHTSTLELDVVELNDNTHLEDFAKVDVKPTSPVCSDDVNEAQQQHMDDDLADLEDDVEVVVPTSVVLRRKLKMVIDPEDDE